MTVASIPYNQCCAVLLGMRLVGPVQPYFLQKVNSTKISNGKNKIITQNMTNEQWPKWYFLNNLRKYN